jgi:hypothetical protein
MYKSWWITQLQVNTLIGQLELVEEDRTIGARVYKLTQVVPEKVAVLLDSSVFEVRDPRDQFQLSHGLTGDKAVWLLRKVPLHAAKQLPLGTYIDIGNNLIRVFEEVSEFTRRY